MFLSHTYKVCNVNTIRMDNDSSSKIIGIDTIKVRIFDGVVRTLSNVKYVPKLRKSLISLRALDNLGYVFSIKNGIMKINKGVFNFS